MGGSAPTFTGLRRPSALIPLAMSIAALALVLGHIAIFGTARQADEGTAAHLWQLLMAGQIPIIAFFAIKWLPRTPGSALLVLTATPSAVISTLVSGGFPGNEKVTGRVPLRVSLSCSTARFSQSEAHCRGFE